jgi:hypothetical protein
VHSHAEVEKLLDQARQAVSPGSMAAESTGDAGRFTAPPCRYSMTLCASALQIVGVVVPRKPIVGELRGCCAR